MYAGEEEFVRGDAHVRRFVASAIGRRQVPADRAEGLVRAAAHELIRLPPAARLADLGVRGLRRRGGKAARSAARVLRA